MNLTTDHWAYAGTPPGASATFKQYPADFVVEEDLGYALTGEGEHQLIYVEKVNTNTAFVAEQLAKFAGIPLRNVTYAGRKDKYALTRQWFGLHMPGKPDVDFSALDLPGVSIVSQTRHNKKLRTGQLKGNRFTITLRHVTDTDSIVSALARLSEEGVPNYYGEQRFGVMRMTDDGSPSVGGNLALAARMAAGETIRNRNKRSMALSALRSWLFNECVSARISQGTLNKVISGDALVLAGSNSFFIHDGDTATLQQRYDEQDLAPSAPLWGRGSLPSQDEALALEISVANAWPDVTRCLEEGGLKQERRPVKIWPEQLEWHAGGDTLTLSFSLPAGCFATSVLRECVNTEQPAQENVSASEGL